jgi:hypothetical protein
MTATLAFCACGGTQEASGNPPDAGASADSSVASDVVAPDVVAADGATGDAPVSVPPTDAGSDAQAPPDAPTQSTDSFLFCPVGCVIDACQRACTPDPSRPQQSSGGMLIQYRGRIQISRAAGDSSLVRCGAIDEQQGCDPPCWGITTMDVEYPRIWFSVENVTGGGGVVHRVHVHLSWNALDSTGHPAMGVSLFTDIITRFEVRVLDPASLAVLSTTTLPINVSPLNPDQTVTQCNVPGPTGQRYYAYDIDVPPPAAGGPSDVIDLTYVGNYE